MHKAFKRLAWIWFALMVLLAVTCASSWLNLGMWNGILNMAIALAKAVIIVVAFMRLARSDAAIRLCVAIALFTLALLFSVSASDFMTRAIHPAPWEQPPAGGS